MPSIRLSRLSYVSFRTSAGCGRVIRSGSEVCLEWADMMLLPAIKYLNRFLYHQTDATRLGMRR